MSLQGLNDSDAGSLTNTSCSNVTTVDLSNASSTVINSFIYGASYPINNLYLHQFLISMFCFFAFWIDHQFVVCCDSSEDTFPSFRHIYFPRVFSVFRLHYFDNATRTHCSDSVQLYSHKRNHCSFVKSQHFVFSAINWFRYSDFCRTIFGYLSPAEAPQAERY